MLIPFQAFNLTGRSLWTAWTNPLFIIHLFSSDIFCPHTFFEHLLISYKLKMLEYARNGIAKNIDNFLVGFFFSFFFGKKDIYGWNFPLQLWVNIYENILCYCIWHLKSLNRKTNSTNTFMTLETKKAMNLTSRTLTINIYGNVKCMIMWWGCGSYFRFFIH